MKTITLSFYSKGSLGCRSEENPLTDIFSYVQILIINFRPRLRIHIPPGDFLAPPCWSSIFDILWSTSDGRDRDSLRAWWIHLDHQRQRTQRSAMELDALTTQEQAARHGQPGCNTILAFSDDGTYVGGDKHYHRILVYDFQGLLWLVFGCNQDHLLPDLARRCGVLHGAQRVLVSS